MKTLQILALVLSLIGASVAQVPGDRAAAVVAMVGADVIPMDSDRVLRDHTVIVKGDRITELGPSGKVRVPSGATRIDARGKFLIPGLAEMHGHIPPPNAPAQFLEAVLFLYVANGVTTVRGMLGAPNQLELRARANRGEILAPTLYLAGPSFNAQSIESPAQAEQKVRQQKAEGWDLLKIHPGLTREEYDSMARTAHEVGIRFGGHVPVEVGILHALEMKQETIDHLDGYIEYLKGDSGPIEEAKLIEIADRTKSAGAWVVPTMALWETLVGVADLEKLRSYPELKYMPSQQVQTWIKAHQDRVNNPQVGREAGRNIVTNRKRLLKILNQRGVSILLGTDAPQQFSVPGFSIHRETPTMIESGMTPFQVLRSGTSAVGEYFKTKDAFGTIAAGKRADLVLLDANPLEDVSNLSRRAGVMVRGRWHSEQEIQDRLQRIAGASAQQE